MDYDTRRDLVHRGPTILCGCVDRNVCVGLQVTLTHQIINELPADWQPFTRGVALHEQGISLTIDDGVHIDVITTIDHELWARCKAPPIEVTLHVSGRQPIVGDAHTVAELVQTIARMITNEIVCGRLNPMKTPVCISWDVRAEIGRTMERLDAAFNIITTLGNHSTWTDYLNRNPGVCR